jgi:hypothetical protein
VRKTPEQRFFARVQFVDKWYDDGVLRTRCLEWTGKPTRDGYGQMYDGSRSLSSHVWIYQRWVGRIPQGMQIDHMCENKACQNVRHMKVKTPWENNRRGNSAAAKAARATHCPQNHEYTPENTIITAMGYRRCRECNKRHQRNYRPKRNANRRKSRNGPGDVDP